MSLPSKISPGKTFNNWTAIRFFDSQQNKCNPRWLFRCACGKEKAVSAGSVVSGGSKSCGCIKKPTQDEARVGRIFKTIKRGAIIKKRYFSIQKSDIAALAESQDWRCAKTGIPFDFSVTNGKRNPFGPTIDRIDNNIGYEPANIQLVSNIYNFCKNEHTDDDVLTFAIALVEHQRSRPVGKLRIVA